jgi:hypothetical protein
MVFGAAQAPLLARDASAGAHVFGGSYVGAIDFGGGPLPLATGNGGLFLAKLPP